MLCSHWSRAVFYPPGLAQLGLDPGRIVLVRLGRACDVLHAAQEGLRAGWQVVLELDKPLGFVLRRGVCSLPPRLAAVSALSWPPTVTQARWLSLPRHAGSSRLQTVCSGRHRFAFNFVLCATAAVLWANGVWSGIMRRVLCLWFPLLAIERIERRVTPLRDGPFAIVAEIGNRLVVQAANLCALRIGVKPGMVLADARAICPPILTRRAEPLADASLLGSLARMMKRYSPLVAIDGDEDCSLTRLGARISSAGDGAGRDDTGRLERLGFTVRAALADTPAAAWALAHYGASCTVVDPGANRAALAGLSVAALRVEYQVAELGRRLGLATIGQSLFTPAPNACGSLRHYRCDTSRAGAG